MCPFCVIRFIASEKRDRSLSSPYAPAHRARLGLNKRLAHSGENPTRSHPFTLLAKRLPNCQIALRQWDDHHQNQIHENKENDWTKVKTTDRERQTT